MEPSHPRAPPSSLSKSAPSSSPHGQLPPPTSYYPAPPSRITAPHKRLQLRKIRCTRYLLVITSTTPLITSPGSPVPYLPLSLQHPVYYAQLRAQQLRNAHQRAWWPAPAPAIFPSVSLQDQITAAMSEPLQRSSQAQLKTSHTHPIKSVTPHFLRVFAYFPSVYRTSSPQISSTSYHPMPSCPTRRWPPPSSRYPTPSP